MHRIVILGGGFGGVAVARELEKRLPASAAVHVTLVNRDNYTLFTPMLHEVAASDIDVTHIVNPLRKLVRRTDVFVGEVVSIDVDRREVHVGHGDGGHPHVLAYDQLVLALGAVTNDYGIPGVADAALPMKTLRDAIALRDRLIAQLEEADFECRTSDRSGLLTFVVAGGGFAGVETVAAAHDFVHDAVRFYRNLRPSDIRMVLVHGGSEILPELDSRLGRYARERLATRGVEIRLNALVTRCTGEEVILSDGSRIAGRTTIWTAGNAPSPVVAQLPFAGPGGRLPVDSCLRVQAQPGLWALGDCAAVPDGKTGRLHPPTAQHAIRQGRALGRNLAATLAGGQPRPFAFSTIGQLAAIGRRTGVASILRFNFSGFLAWWLWRTIYLAKLPRLEKKIRVALDWSLDLLFSKDLVQLGGADGRRRSARSASRIDQMTTSRSAAKLASTVASGES